MSKKPKIIVILGPTSSGKSDVAIRLAKKFGGEIISADSRQIYRGMDIGTGKATGALAPVVLSACLPARQEAKPACRRGRDLIKKRIFLSEGIPHHMIDIVSPKTRFSAAQFKKKVDKIIPEIINRGKLPIICGGTGFWIKTIVDNVTYPGVKPDWKLRNKLLNKTAPYLFAMLKKLDPKRAKNIDAKNKARLVRALEICKAIGKVPALSCHCEEVQRPRQSRDCFPARPAGGASLAMTNNYDFLQIGLSLPKEKLHKNIKKRLQKRFDSGIIEEVEKLRKLGLSWKKIQSFGLGYFWIPKYLKGEVSSKEELFEKIYQAEKDYAKRQMTWFRKDKRIKWVGKYRNIEKKVQSFIK